MCRGKTLATSVHMCNVNPPERTRAGPHMLNPGLLKTMPRAAAEGGVVRVAMDLLMRRTVDVTWPTNRGR